MGSNINIIIYLFTLLQIWNIMSNNRQLSNFYFYTIYKVIVTKSPSSGAECGTLEIQNFASSDVYATNKHGFNYVCKYGAFFAVHDNVIIKVSNSCFVM